MRVGGVCLGFCMAIITFVLPLFAQENFMNKSFVHPGMLHTQQDLDFIKQKIASGEEPWKTAWEQLRNDETSSLDFQPEPHTHVIRGPYGRPSIGDRELSRSAKAAHHHALLWALTGEKAHAQKAIEVLNAWSYRLWDFQLNDAKLLAAWTGDAFCNAAEILKHTDSGWQEKDIEQFTRLMRTVYYPLLENFFPEANGNWDGAIINTILSIGIFCDDRDMFLRAIDQYRFGRVNGGITKYIYPSGQCQESTRDQAHTQLGLGEFALACQVAYNQGIDLYGLADNRLALGFEYTAKYLLGEDVPSYGVVSDDRRDQLRDIFESVYQHYRFEKGIDVPYLARIVEKTRGTKRSGDALIFYKGPVPSTPQTLLPAPKPSMQAPMAGAQKAPMVSPPETAIFVGIEDDLQAVLDGCEEGSWVVLEKGVYVLPDPLKIPSGLTLSGQGLETILFRAADKTGPALMNATSDLRDVVVRDLVVEGATSTETPSDPNSRRTRQYFRNAPSRSGIVFAAEHAGQMRNIRFEHVTVQNCTHDGVAIRGAAQVSVVACDFSDNGSSVVPGAGLQHNLLLTRSQDVDIRDSRFDTSPWGSGVDVSHCQNVRISNNEVARNALCGVRVVESEDIQVVHNLAEGNDAHGIAFDKQMDGCRNILVTDNITQLNGKLGIYAQGVHDITLKNNVTENNRDN